MSLHTGHKIVLTHDGETRTLTGWANRLGVSRQTLFARLKTYGAQDLDRVLISGTKKKGRGSSVTSIPKLDGLSEVIASIVEQIPVSFSSAELDRLQEIKRRRRNQDQGSLSNSFSSLKA